MKKLIVLVFLVLSACSSGLIDLGLVRTAPASVRMIELRRLENADQAEVALYVATKLYEANVGALNRAHAAGLMTEANYQVVVADADSVARRVQKALGNATAAIAAWRAGGSREYFDRYYAAIDSGIAELSKEIR